MLSFLNFAIWRRLNFLKEVTLIAKFYSTPTFNLTLKSHPGHSKGADAQECPGVEEQFVQLGEPDHFLINWNFPILNVTIFLPVWIGNLFPFLFSYRWSLSALSLCFSFVTYPGKGEAGREKLGQRSNDVASRASTLWADERMREPEWSSEWQKNPEKARVGHSDPHQRQREQKMRLFCREALKYDTFCRKNVVYALWTKWRSEPILKFIPKWWWERSMKKLTKYQITLNESFSTNQG